jgi:protein SCO1/2
MEGIKNIKRGLVWVLSIAGCLVSAGVAHAQINLNEGSYMTPAVDAHFDDRLNKVVPGNLSFINSTGNKVTLGHYFSAHEPVVFMMPSYRCKLDCAAEMHGLALAVANMQLVLGKDFQVVTVSLSPHDTQEDARSAATRAWKGIPASSKLLGGWHALVGDEKNVVLLAGNLGVHFVQDAAKRNFNNPTGVIITTGNGRIFRYIYGTQFMSTYLQSSIKAAADRKKGIPTEQMITYCYGYKSATGRNGRLLQDLIVTSGCLTAVLVAGFIGLSLYKEVNGRRKPPTVAV